MPLRSYRACWGAPQGCGRVRVKEKTAGPPPTRPPVPDRPGPRAPTPRSAHLPSPKKQSQERPTGSPPTCCCGTLTWPGP
ncbi:hypothetical protein NDU88_001252 [Pleurodeles waltl]|uniref:Uncharacterized protein n=1 Tax=Pleurodeles waltl TaxID=8319 RepID=A0AAV7UU58_PLEWA|nr:hypothetical protein NDU88_001252 [Pleurodeles waltl]